DIRDDDVDQLVDSLDERLQHGADDGHPPGKEERQLRQAWHGHLRSVRLAHSDDGSRAAPHPLRMIRNAWCKATVGSGMTPDDSRRVSLLLGLLFGLAGMGSSSAAVALPLMGEDLGVGVGVAAWTI